jgi:hypothetical protein
MWRMSFRSGLFLAALAPVALVAAPPAPAAEGLFLTWNDCALSAVASHDLSWACDANTGEQRLYCAFRLSAPVDSVLGFELVVDIQHSAPSLPDWWRLAAGGCRWGQLGAGLDFRAHADCADFSLGRAAGGVLGYYVTEPRGGDDQARIKVAGSWLPGLGYATLDDTGVYYAARIVLGNGRTTGEGACAGCALPACLVFNCLWLLRQPGAAGGDVLVNSPGFDADAWATWQGGSGASCAAVPVRAVTWGRLKGMYR